jgi:ATP-dependent Clp protease protease subunit
MQCITIKSGAMTPTNMTPYIIEERQLNISQLDVFQD